uniref:Rhodanese domain-containing protein n=1 Tax=Moniliophthora roreri TaxID=221103 RepID=A0A0W0FDS8_MONRR
MPPDDDSDCDLPGSFTFDEGDEEERDRLQKLRESVKRNLKLRPIRSVGNLRLTDDDHDEWFTPLTTSIPHPIHPTSLANRLQSDKKPLLIDTRPLAAFQASHIRHSINLAVPSLILKRWRKGKVDLSSLRQYITTDAGKATWDHTIANCWDGDVILCDQDPLMHILPALLPNGSVDYLFGGINHPPLQELLTSDSAAGTTNLTVDTKQKYKPKQQLELVAVSPPPSPNPKPKPNLIRIDTRSVERLPRLSLKTRAATLSVPPSPTPHLPKPMPLPPLKLPPIVTSPATDSPTSSIFSAYYTPPHTPSFNSQKTPKASPRNDEFVVGSSTWTDVPTPTTTEPPRTSFKQSFTFGGGEDDPPTTGEGEDEFPVFLVSTILPGFLYLGPEPTTREHVDELQSKGVKRILNLAEECSENDHGLGLRKKFEKYIKIGMRDTVEEEGVAKGVREVCVVLGISPNIGFVSELMNFEEEELGGKSLGVNHSSNAANIQHNPNQTLRPQSSRRNLRKIPGTAVNGSFTSEHTTSHGHAQSISGPIMQLPAEGAGAGVDEEETTSESTLSTPSPRGMQLHIDVNGGDGAGKVYPMSAIDGHGAGEEDGKQVLTPISRTGMHDPYQELEVRDATGRYRHARRAPVDEATLQPMRRVSKAGLESGVWEG